MSIFFTTGVMGTGKSRRLIETSKEDTRQHVVLAGSLSESSGEVGIVESRDGQRIDAMYLNQNSDEHNWLVISLWTSVFGIKVLYIDEVQFLSVNLVDKIIRLANKHGIEVYFFGLSTDFRGSYFDASKYLLDTLPEENIIDLKMACEIFGCHNVADYNARIVDGKVIKEGETFVSEKSIYMSICKDCYEVN